MSHLTFETDAPPMTKMALSSPVAAEIFHHLVTLELARESAANSKVPVPLVPNYVRVVPYVTADNLMKYAVHAAVDLSGPGRLQVRDYFLETVWTRDRLGIKDSERDTVLLPDLGPYQYFFAAIGPMYAIESGALPDALEE